jgi:hypothetical protein
MTKENIDIMQLQVELRKCKDTQDYKQFCAKNNLEVTKSQGKYFIFAKPECKNIGCGCTDIQYDKVVNISEGYTLLQAIDKYYDFQFTRVLPNEAKMKPKQFREGYVEPEESFESDTD